MRLFAVIEHRERKKAVALTLVLNWQEFPDLVELYMYAKCSADHINAFVLISFIYLYKVLLT